MNLTIDKSIGLLLCALTVIVICGEWGIADWATEVKSALVIALVALVTWQVRLARKAFVGVAMVLSLALIAVNDDWKAIIVQALSAAGFIGAFFAALTTLRSVAVTSPAIKRAGAFLAAQPPGRRYAALTAGGQAFALLLSYGAIQLLGALAVANAKSEPNAEIRNHRIRRMLLAIQRGFISTLPWSPLSFAVVISTAVIPETSWSQILIPGLVTSAIVATIGWGLDTVFKPRLTTVPVRTKPPGTWGTMLPLAVLLGALVAGVVMLSLITNVRIVGLVALLVPAIALVWLVFQYWGEKPVAGVFGRVKRYALDELPTYRGELVLLMMAGYIGTVGAQLLGPATVAAGLDLSLLPWWLVLVSFVWIIPLTGQFGMNPILAVTLLAPLIPCADCLDVDPTAIVVALTAGWVMSGASSPFTATTLLIGSFAGISARRVGLIWNGAYTLICCSLLSVWVVLYGFLA